MWAQRQTSWVEGWRGQWNWGGEKMRGKRGEEERAVGRRESRRDHDGLVDIQSASPFLT